MAEPQSDSPAPDLVSLVIPVYNEQESLTPLLKEIDEAFRVIGIPREVIFVDDGSSDKSWEVVSTLAATSERVRGLRFRRNFAKAAALQAGFRAARGSVVLTLDADLQDDPHEIARFLDAIRGGLDVVSGWKKVRHDPWHKVMPSRVFNWVVSWVSGVKLHDHNCGFKAYRAAVVREIRLYGELHRFVPVLAAANGFRVGELVVNHRARKFGRSHYGARRFVKGFLDLLTVRFVTTFGRRPMHPLGTFALLAFAAGTLLFLAVAANGLVRSLADDSFGAGPVVQILAGVVAVGAWLLGGQALLAGFVAELLVANTQTDDPYRITETTPPDTKKSDRS
ncbi:glycosyltransferase family 2 protein [Fimbriiglobus ruber]|uniref:Glycosyl transferase, family 2 n=1 Tax=Fimbriiglobus ruber TaxID=1908690 RepID=A0A225EAZ5_9BACT|nr:glycosyltransferase family 2 protein [Fimbriiglobus ruber]OWK47206.1 Glycosyl transferase, family 2 [Fimbriiglobus ruber]